jgi:predicted dithiol-disulfide oxidoreductase (DUF899 family)
VFDTNDGPKTLAELFDGRSQLLVYHFMHGPLQPDGCPGCTFGAGHWQGDGVLHLENHGVSFVFASRSPLAELNAYKERFGWRVPWVSSGGTDFNRDFALFTEEQRRTGRGMNFGTPKRADMSFDDMELMALSAFALEDGVVHHTYSCFDRGTDVLIPTWQFLDRAPRGRLADGENGYAVSGWPRRPDEY